MRLIIRTIVVVAILWIGVLLSAMAVLFHSEESVGGLGLEVSVSHRPRGQYRTLCAFQQRCDRRQ